MAESQTNKKSLVIVESPAKAKTINKYLGADYQVMASMGHVRDLPSTGLNVDVKNDFEPTYKIIPGRKKMVSGLKAAAGKCQKLYLATDLDREGEAIAWHLAQLLGVNEDKVFRVIFNAITQSAIKNAFERPGKIDMDKVLAQQARRILDRLVGYQISPLLWKKVARGLSAGRVQSVAVKIIVERERQIRAFVPEEYWLIPAIFSSDLRNDYSQDWLAFIGNKKESERKPTSDEQDEWLRSRNAFMAELYKIGDQKFHAPDNAAAERIFQQIKSCQYFVSDLQEKQLLSRPSPPFITSTLQQAAANRLGFSAQRTMRIAQQLYEGIDVGSMGSLGLITYMRTDSTHLSAEAGQEVRSFIQRHFGQQYLPAGPIIYKSSKSAQQAHEAIRPTDVDLTPAELKSFLTDEQYKLYDIVWRRFVACQMTDARWLVTTVDIVGKSSIGDCCYRATGRILSFDGFTKLWPVSTGQQQLPPLQKNQRLSTVDIRPQQHFTKPPARFNEASLIKALEKEGIGRPSTYAAIVSTIQQRNYVEQIKKQFYATQLGELVTDKLNLYFPDIMDIAFTRRVEQQLDKIEEQHLDWHQVLKEFYGPFEQSLKRAEKEMKHAKAETEPSPYTCPKCGQPLVYRFGKKGKFLSCSAYPKCKFASPCDSDGKMIEAKKTEHKCPNCGKQMVERTGRFGKFLGCSGYPECKTILKLDKDGNIAPNNSPAQPTEIKCFKCKEGLLVIRQGKKGPFLGCNRFPKCRTIISIEHLDNLKKLQDQGNWPPGTVEEAHRILGKKKTAAGKKNAAEK